MVARRTSPGYYVAVGVLALLLVAAMGFVVAMALRPSPAPAVASVTTDPNAIECPAGTGRASCYATTVTNVGGQTGTFTCRALGADGQTATFTANSSGLVTLGTGESQPLTTAVTVKREDIALAPSVTCTLFS